MVLTVTPQARAISAVSAPASRIALARAILGSMMSGVSALMPLKVGGEGGVGDRVGDVRACGGCVFDTWLQSTRKPKLWKIHWFSKHFLKSDRMSSCEFIDDSALPQIDNPLFSLGENANSGCKR